MRKNNQQSKYFLYARKSSESEDRQMASIESQISELKNLAQQNNLKIVRIFKEEKSAKAPGREVFNEMIEKLKKGEADGIVCWKLNRLSRNPTDSGIISQLLQDEVVKHIFTFGRSYYPEDNVLVMAVEQGMANQFIRDLSIDTKRGLRAKAERGWYPTFTTLGYMHNPLKKKGEKEIIKDPERFDVMRKVFDLMLTGKYPPCKVIEIANEKWGLRTKAGRKVARSTIYRILTDPFYYGEFEYPKESGNWYKGKHEPIITKSEFYRIQEILGNGMRPRPQTQYFPFTGMIRCGECGAMITAENKTKRQKNGNIHHYTYYHCTKRKDPNCSQKNLRQESLEEQIVDVLEAIRIPTEFKKWALDVLREENKREFSDKKKMLESQQKAYNVCIKKIDTLIDMRANGEITEEEFSQKRLGLLGEKERLHELLNDSDGQMSNWIEKAETLLDYSQNAKDKFLNGTQEEKKNVLSALGSNLTLKDGKLLIAMENPFPALEKVASETKQIQGRLEPVEFGLNKRKLGEIYAQYPNLLREQDSNL
ncbi:MAG: recombinase family protein [Patescibacteria group bacterium]